MSDQARADAKGYYYLHRVWESLEEAAHELSAAIGVPICVEGCGLCCITNTPSAFQVEILRATSYLLELDVTSRDRILDRIESWLVREDLPLEPPMDPALSIPHPLKGKSFVGKTRVSGDELLVCHRGRCPLLGPDLRCSVHPVRPLSCRAWGVTLAATPWCGRPRGRGERDEHDRAYLTEHATVTLRGHLRAMVVALKDHPELLTRALFPTALYAQFRMPRLMELLPHVATVKLVRSTDLLAPHLFEEGVPDLVGATRVTRRAN